MSATTDFALVKEGMSSTQPGEIIAEKHCIACFYVGKQLPAVSKCLKDGQLLCKEHADMHAKAYTDHTMENEAEPPARCLEHNEDFKMFCVQHRKLLCDVCYAISHSGHTVSSVEQASEQENPHVQGAIDQANSTKQCLEQWNRDI